MLPFPGGFFVRDQKLDSLPDRWRSPSQPLSEKGHKGTPPQNFLKITSQGVVTRGHQKCNPHKGRVLIFHYFWWNYCDRNTSFGAPKCSVLEGKSIPLFQVILGWWNIIIWPDYFNTFFCWLFLGHFVKLELPSCHVRLPEFALKLTYHLKMMVSNRNLRGLQRCPIFKGSLAVSSRRL